jgi:hypothetical protein
MIQKYNPTAVQKNVIVTARTTARIASFRMIASALTAHDAIVDLPLKNEDGDAVRHGANTWMMYIRDSLLQAFSMLHGVVGRDYYDLVRYQHRFANGRFYSAEEFNSNLDHLNKEIVNISVRMGTDKEIIF